MVEPLVCFGAQLPPMRMAEFVARPDLAGVNSMESPIPVTSSQVRAAAGCPPRGEHTSRIFLVPRFSRDIPDDVYSAGDGFRPYTYDYTFLSSSFLVPSGTPFSYPTLSDTFDMRSANRPSSLAHPGMKG